MIDKKNTIEESLIEAETLLMSYAISHGVPIPKDYHSTAETTHQEKLENVNTLALAVKPATVESIGYINSAILPKASGKKWAAIPLFTKCLIVAGFSLIILISVSLLPNVNEANQSRSLLSASGIDLLTNIIFICSASLLGVMFFLLKTIAEKIKNYTLLPIDSIEINSSIIIGLISGFITSELVVVNQASINDYVEIQKMTLALLGGFASDTIFTALKGLVTKFKSFLQPGT